jgi:hypothetical protein
MTAQFPHGQQHAYPPHYAPPTSSAGAASLGLGVVALFLCWVPFLGLFGLALAVISLAVGFRGRKLLGMGYVVDGGLATTGIVLGAVALVISFVMHAIIVWALLASATG